MAKMRLAINGKYYRQEDIDEREQLEEVKRLTRYASAGVKALAILLHMMKWRLFYNVKAIYTAELLLLKSPFDDYEFDLWSSCD